MDDSFLSPLLLGDFVFRFLSQGTHPDNNLRVFCSLLISTTNSPQNVVMASLAYYQRLKAINATWLKAYPASLSFTVCLMLAFKFLEDAPYLARSWSKASGFSLQNINQMERHVLHKFNYNLHITHATISHYASNAKQFYVLKPSPPRRALIQRFHPYALPIPRRHSYVTYCDMAYTAPFVVWQKPLAYNPTPPQFHDFIHSIPYPSLS
ncbi:hypothetical protein DSO57_1008683 [Entomophthora muscae]|uniref:Uncharacterized protein n=2 Tax=Entomophthora muscae TaxID=34485 RepID=A0ACC2U5I7_9FUNG|nr:hypothetical protein DSO57_1000358 [Entomophthora muscae]KAJ9082005.1 hypothetical protein DSO57_1008683 [Entomophthora muscae]